ncbi:MAG TPA: shikimate kinase [Arenimonas sp.]|uniref:shikimate kinase n=1 Tax=Arenimonas sp. TaxID=1872635 RepID=UPI002C1FD789|nr:shikimate kinase [Arenimonas sp.]HMB57017.1 shikimate kinase [Arenimonas sp.]
MNPAPNLVLVGPMGAGKTSIGRRLAAKLGLSFVDADHRLEEVTGAAVPLIFEHEGEDGFRMREAQLIAELMQGSAQLIATGGGAVLSPDNRQLLCARGFVVYLMVGIEQQLERLARDRTRPLLADGNKRAKLEALAQARAPLYEEIADLAFDSDGLVVATAVQRLATQLETRWQRAEAA